VRPGHRREFSGHPATTRAHRPCPVQALRRCQQSLFGAIVSRQAPIPAPPQRRRGRPPKHGAHDHQSAG
jgi:hypothetical protein